MTIAREIRCPDCDGVAHLVTPLAEATADEPADAVEPGDVLTYACEDCLSRWDVVVDEEDLDDA
ncbi:MAG TPA: hypothetical protein VFZ83_11900 [Acidimicrobiia bacterium]|nr:hypothetical protein [Acidimicrobiia bacterium]